MNIKKNDHHRNVQEVMNNYLEEMKMVNEAPKYFYTRDGGVKKVDEV